MTHDKPVAKLSRPRLHDAVARTRLFDLLDDATSRPASCVVGPPGAGKTTLVASWLDDRALPGIWYQVDAGDTDLSTFFYYLRRAAEPFRRSRQPLLPLLTPEYRSDLRGFARRFFRDLFERLPDRAVVVLDNYQEVPVQEEFHRVVAEAVEQVPAGNLLIVISRRDPPDCYARFVANADVALVDWRALRLTLEETRALAGLRGGDEDRVRALHERCGGWAAGLTLLLHNPAAPQGSSVVAADDLDQVFKYFAGQVLEQLDAETRRFLVETACLPHVPVQLASELTGNARAGAILDELYRRHLFVHRRPGEEVSYQYHPLFQAFLRKRAQAELPADRNKVLLRDAATLLDCAGQCDEAYPLYAEAQEWQCARDLILREGAALIAQGRARTLRAWIDALPEASRTAQPWLDYWLGQALVAENQRDARGLFERAAEVFARHAEPFGEAMAVAAAIDSIYFEWSDFRALADAVDRLERALSRVPSISDKEAEARIHSSLVVAMLYGRPNHPRLLQCVDKLSGLLDTPIELNAKISSATFLLTFCTLTLDRMRGRDVCSRIEPLLHDVRISALSRVWWHIRVAWFLQRLEADSRSALRALDRAVEVIAKQGLEGLRSSVMLERSYRVGILAACGDHRDAMRIVDQTRRHANASRPMDAFHLIELEIHLAAALGDGATVMRLAASMHEAARATGMVYAQVLSYLIEATGHALRGDVGATDRCCAEAHLLADGTCFAPLLMETAFLRTAALFNEHRDAEGAAALARALEQARVADYPFPERAYFNPADLLSKALSLGIEVRYVDTLIRKLDLRAPASEIEFWPWPVEIFTLGDFKLRQNGAPVEFRARTPKKVLALLKTIIALGGRGVAQTLLIDALWPDEEADDALNALGVTLSRLRKLLDCPDAIVVADEQVTLNPQRCWVDAFAFQRLVDSFDRAGDAQRLHACVDRVLGLYQGSFLPVESAERWSMSMRMRLRDRFARFVQHAGVRLEALAAFEDAIRCYRKGLDADDLAEEFYQGLMRCHLALGRSAEGMQVFRRLRQTLSVLLGIAPSAESERLAALLQVRAGNAISRGEQEQFDAPVRKASG